MILLLVFMQLTRDLFAIAKFLLSIVLLNVNSDCRRPFRRDSQALTQKAVSDGAM